MFVRDLMQRPYVIDKDITFTEAARVMSSKEIGSLIFVTKNKATGIITHDDLIRNFSSHSKISTAMKKILVTISPDDDINVALEKMRANDIRHLPVIDKSGMPVGVITVTDIAAHAEELDEEFFFN